jgi:hypothetical protein
MTSKRWLVIAGLALAGCGGTESPDVVVADATTTDIPAGGSDSALDTAANPDVRADVVTPALGFDGMSPPVRSGNIGIGVGQLLGAEISSASAAFENTGGQPGRCTELAVGPRRITRCAGPAGGDAGASPSAVSAGLVTIASSAPGSSPVTLSPGSDNAYSEYQNSGVTWSAGNRLTFTAAGATVPMFNASLVFPAPVDFTQPSPATAGTNVRIDRAVGIDLAWTAADSGAGSEILATVLQRDMMANVALTITCGFAPGLGRGTIPPAALAYLTPTDRGGQPGSNLALGTRARVTATAGEYAITIDAEDVRYLSTLLVR